jgi:hypothetical protein
VGDARRDLAHHLQPLRLRQRVTKHAPFLLQGDHLRDVRRHHREARRLAVGVDDHFDADHQRPLAEVARDADARPRRARIADRPALQHRAVVGLDGVEPVARLGEEPRARAPEERLVPFAHEEKRAGLEVVQKEREARARGHLGDARPLFEELVEGEATRRRLPQQLP